MMPTDLLLLHAELIHAVKIALEAILAAFFLTGLWIMLPYIGSGGGRR
jgi:hypothetical protein